MRGYGRSGMNRPLTAVFAALEALLVVGIGVGISLVPLTVMWAFQYGLQIDWIVFWRAAVDIWLLGHGVDMRVALDPTVAASVGFEAASDPFRLSLAPLGFAVLTLLMGQRAGRRIAETTHYLIGIGVALGTFALLAGGLTLTAVHDLARPSLPQGTLLTTLVFMVGLGIGAVLARQRLGGTKRDAVTEMIRERLKAVPPHAVAVIRSSVTGGAAAAAAVIAGAAVIVAVLLVTNYADIISLYEGVQAGVLGGVAITIAQLAFVPNLVVWAGAWLIGPGFAIGSGSAVSPLGTTLGPLPAIPVLGALPTGDLAWGFLGLLVPIIAGFLAGVVVRPRLLRGIGTRSRALWFSVTGFSVGATAALLLGLLAWASAGSAGPGRLAEVGPSALWVGVFVLLEVGLAGVLGLYAAGIRSKAETSQDP
ncbi:MAG: hypothetical protein JWP30_454 [Homoserinimonas sp.]|nr:hypothetical protein [Homoserinimonas sp.]